MREMDNVIGSTLTEKKSNLPKTLQNRADN